MNSSLTAPAIETRYKSHLFRSRLEARWAVFFDAMDIAWEYEKEGYELRSGRYLPDFWLPRVKMWAEVKGLPFSKEELRKCEDLASATGFPVILLDGVPAPRFYYAYDRVISDGDCVLTDMLFDDGHDYYHRENRFYMNSGDDAFPEVLKVDVPIHVYEAITAALSARFEYGEFGGLR